MVYLLPDKKYMPLIHSNTNGDEIREIIEGIIRLNYCNNNFTVSRLALILRICESHLRDITNDYFEMSPSKLIESVKIEKALKSLASGKNVSTSARVNGFSNSRSFRNAFKRRLFITPSEYRGLIASGDKKNNKIVKRYINLLWKN